MQLKKLSSHFILALSFFLMTLGQQYLFYYLKDLPIIWLPFDKYAATFGFMLFATFIKQNVLRYLFLSFVILLNSFQMGHLSYFGTQILPVEIYLTLTQFHEIQGTLLVELHHVWVPLLFTIIPALLGWFIFKKNRNLYGSKWVGILFCLYFIYNPVRTMVTGNTWGRQPSTRELGGMNVYLAFSYFSGKILPHKLLKEGSTEASNSSLNLKLKPAKKPEWDKVIVILGESLTPNHMGLFGYSRETTPFLSSLKEQPNFWYTTGISGGVSTDIAVAFVFNMGFGEAGSIKAAKGQHCLFKLAKDQGYKTHFLSIQSAQQLRYIAPYICSSSLDDYQTLENIAPETADHQAAKDTDLLPTFKTLLQNNEKEFIVLHQRGSHAPWELRSTKESQIFTHDSPVNHYDNSVVEFDSFMKNFYSIVSESPKKILVLYFSDHGEGLGEDGHWGHGRLVPTSYEIPVMLMSFNKNLPEGNIPKYITHYNLSLLLAQELGFDSNQPPLTQINDYVIFGNDIDGFAGKLEVKFKPDGTYETIAK